MSVPSGAARRVLVVDDDDDIRAVLGDVLRRADLDVIDAATGRSALRRAFEDRPDVVVSIWDCPTSTAWRCCAA